ncbi:WD40-repeat-containing domain protein [Obelidium mucronatum]|nr:WD40-repeat-containing domain protein [Obelidium mucronatum]
MNGSSSSGGMTSDEVNYLVYRYLLESGFTHSSFAFAQEAAVHTREYLHHHVALPSAYPSLRRADEVRGSRVAPGALLGFLQRGLLYAEVEAHTLEDGTSRRCSAPFSLCRAHECVEDAAGAGAGDEHDASDKDRDRDRDRDRDAPDRKKLRRDSRRERDREKKLRAKPPPDAAAAELAHDAAALALASAADVTIYKPAASAGAVYCVAWNPRFMLLAAGSADGKVRLWRVPADSSEGTMTDCAVTLDHANPDEENGVTSIDWHPQGMMIATGGVTGNVKVWTKSGELKYTMARHTSTVFTTKWNKRGDLLGTASADASVIIWDAATGELRQQFQCHDSAVLDLDWKDDVTFATSSSDKLVYVCRMGFMEPIKVFSGHAGDVNGIQWDSTGQLLASGSDDNTIKVWTMDTNSPLFNLVGHKLEVFCLRWAPPNPTANTPSTTASTTTTPTATTTSNSNIFPQNRMLATGSFDSTVRIWDMTTGKCVQTLEKHTSQVSALSFSADGAFLVTGGFDNVFNVWRCRDWSLVRTYKGGGSVFEVQWGIKGDKVSVCFNDGVVAVVHLASLRNQQ